LDEVVVMERDGPVTVIGKTVPSLLPRGSVTLTLMRKVPARVGLPDKTPPLERVMPGGRLCVSADQTYGNALPVAASVAE
jgi:hypothetical protein